MKPALLLALGALVLPAQAGATLTPEKQAQLQRNGWSVTDSGGPLVVEDDWRIGCPNGRARGAGSSIKNYAGQVQVFGKIVLAVGASGGRIVLCGRGEDHGSPGYRWSNVWGPLLQVQRPCCGGRHLWLVYKQEWVYRNSTLVDQYWSLRPLAIKAHVRKGTNSIWFEMIRRWQ